MPLRSHSRFRPWFHYLSPNLWLSLICVTLYLATLLIDRANVSSDLASLRVLAPSLISVWLFGASGSIPIFEQGHWWTIFSAGWLHGDLLHLTFNLVWLNQLAPAIVRAYDSSRLVIIYVVSAATGIMASATISYYWPTLPTRLQGAELTVGASGAIFGFLGALIVYGQRKPHPRIFRIALVYAVLLFGFSFTMPNVDNWGHLGGLLGGYLCAYWLDTDHRPSVWTKTAIALSICTIASIAASLISGLALLQEHIHL